jgi:predicted TIM-barrel fold metal-dependent hydrolase
LIDDMFVFDAVVHAFDATAANVCSDYGIHVLESIYQGQCAAVPDHLHAFALSRARFFQRMTAGELGSALFHESQTDAAIFHAIPAWGILKDLSPLSIGKELRDLFPARVFLYGAVSPVEGDRALDELDRQIDEIGILGVKLYPVDIIDGKLRTVSLADEKHVYPIIERCRAAGVRTIAIHKALPIGTAPTSVFHPGDVDHAAADFPDMTFEIVHGGYAWTDETAFQVGRFPNVVVNLESTIALLLRRPYAFAHIIGKLLEAGGPTKILWGTGAIPHPRPLIEAFSRFQMPAELSEQYGYRPLTREDKRLIFGNNAAALHRVRLPTARPCDDDTLRDPWQLVPTPHTLDPLALRAERVGMPSKEPPADRVA